MMDIQNTIKQTHTLQDIAEEVKVWREVLPNGNIWVVFDVDMTLTIPNHPAVNTPAFMAHRDIWEETVSQLTPFELDWVLTWAAHRDGGVLIEQDAVKHLDHMSKLGAKRLGLTACTSGPLDHKGSAEEQRHHMLTSLGIDFSTDWTVNNKVFDHFEPYGYSFPLYHEGILISHGEGNKARKGDVLEAFMDHCQEKPHVVIFADDRMCNLENMSATLKKTTHNIHYVGFEFLSGNTAKIGDPSRQEFASYWRDMVSATHKKHRVKIPEFN